MNEKVKSGKPIVFGHSHAGTGLGDSPNDERHFEGALTTQGGLNFTLMIVSDGEGALGAQAAQQTIQSIVEVCQASPLTQGSTKKILALLEQAIGEANRRVYTLAQSQPVPENMLATAMVVVIIAGHLYVANIGHSRAYLIRNSQVIQLTIDHSWATHWAAKGELSKEQARRQPDAQRLTRAIGQAPTVQVDFGLYLRGGQEGAERAFQQQGLQLNANDVLLVCSDGLTHPIAGKQADYVSREEIRNVVERSTAEQAAKTLVDLAVGRNVDDNVTALLAEMPGRARPKPISPRLRIGKTAAVLISVLLCLSAAALLYFLPRLLPSSPEPTPTLSYAYITSGSLLFRQASGDTISLNAGEALPFGEGSLAIIGGPDAVLDLPGNYRLRIAGTVEHQSRIEFLQGGISGTPGDTILKVYSGSLFVIAAGGADTNISITVMTDIGSASVTGAALAGMRLGSEKLFVDCFSGECLIAGKDGSELLLASGQRGQIDAGETAALVGSVVKADYPEYAADFIQSLPNP
ncbi:PP2C family protein-serine/threonine phosphatase [Chloroflexota bacterium]